MGRPSGLRPAFREHSHKYFGEQSTEVFENLIADALDDKQKTETNPLSFLMKQGIRNILFEEDSLAHNTYQAAKKYSESTIQRARSIRDVLASGVSPPSPDGSIDEYDSESGGNLVQQFVTETIKGGK